MKTIVIKARSVLLLVAGALLILIGALILTSPVDFYASNNIELGANVSLLNELKAPAGFLITAGLFMIVAIFFRRLADPAILLGAMIYLSYAGARFVSIISDGMPAAGLVQATTLEAVVGLACLTVLVLRHQPAKEGA
jgi:hypothetical protein